MYILNYRLCWTTNKFLLNDLCDQFLQEYHQAVEFRCEHQYLLKLLRNNLKQFHNNLRAFLNSLFHQLFSRNNQKVTYFEKTY